MEGIVVRVDQTLVIDDIYKAIGMVDSDRPIDAKVVLMNLASYVSNQPPEGGKGLPRVSVR